MRDYLVYTGAMSKRNRALAMAVRRAFLLIAEALKVWAESDDDGEPGARDNGLGTRKVKQRT